MLNLVVCKVTARLLKVNTVSWENAGNDISNELVSFLTLSHERIA
jgi:hypothetical protein